MNDTVCSGSFVSRLVTHSIFRGWGRSLELLRFGVGEGLARGVSKRGLLQGLRLGQSPSHPVHTVVQAAHCTPPGGAMSSVVLLRAVTVVC